MPRQRHIYIYAEATSGWGGRGCGKLRLKRGGNKHAHEHAVYNCCVYFRVKKNGHHLQNFPSQRILRNHMLATEHIPLVAQVEPKVLRKNNNTLQKALLKFHQKS